MWIVLCSDVLYQNVLLTSKVYALSILSILPTDVVDILFYIQLLFMKGSLSSLLSSFAFDNPFCNRSYNIITGHSVSWIQVIYFSTNITLVCRTSWQTCRFWVHLFLQIPYAVFNDESGAIQPLICVNFLNISSAL